MCKEFTAAGGSRVLWASEMGVRIFGGLIVWTVEVITKLVLVSEGILKLGRIQTYVSVCRWTRQVRIRWKLRWVADMIEGLQNVMRLLIFSNSTFAMNFCSSFSLLKDGTRDIKNIFLHQYHLYFFSLPYFSIDNAHPKLFRHSF
jgi:hypothetical protein